MAWYPVDQSLFNNNPKVLRLVEVLKVGEAQALGHLTSLWSWALDHAPDGVLPESKLCIALGAKWSKNPEKFIESLVVSGWIDVDSEKLLLHDWMDWAGKSIQERAKKRDQMREKRADTVPPPYPHRTPTVPELCGTKGIKEGIKGDDEENNVPDTIIVPLSCKTNGKVSHPLLATAASWCKERKVDLLPQVCDVARYRDQAESALSLIVRKLEPVDIEPWEWLEEKLHLDTKRWSRLQNCNAGNRVQVLLEILSDLVSYASAVAYKRKSNATMDVQPAADNERHMIAGTNIEIPRYEQ